MDTSNIFPTSAEIADIASGMSELQLDGYAQHERTLKEKEIVEKKNLINCLNNYIAAGEQLIKSPIPENEKKKIKKIREESLAWHQREIRNLEKLQQEFEAMYQI